MRHRLYLLIAALVLCTAAAFAEAREDWIQAGPVQRQRLRELIRTRYPTLPEKAVGFLEERQPRFFTQAAITRLEVILAKHPEAVTTLPAQVMSDLHARHPHLVPRIAIAFWSSDPTVTRVPERGWVLRQYPGLAQDVISVVKEKHGALPARLRAEVSRIVAETDPSLPVDIALDTLRLIPREKVPELVAARRKGLAFRQMMADDPELALAFWKMMDERHAERVYRVAHRAVSEIGPRHGRELASLALDLARLVDGKYPDLPARAILHRVEAHRKVVDPAFGKRFAERLQAEFPGLLSEVMASVDRHSPTLRADLRAAMEQRFPGLRQALRDYVSAEFPHLRSEVEGILR